MKTIIRLATAGAIGAALLAPVAFGQGTQQTISLMRVDVTKVSTGYRTSKVLGSSVVNDADETVGTIDDVIISTDRKAPYVVLSVGGFLGLGAHLVAVPYDSLMITNRKIMLPGGSKAELKALPEFKYAS
jgi:hypothetical protein